MPPFEDRRSLEFCHSLSSVTVLSHVLTTHPARPMSALAAIRDVPSRFETYSRVSVVDQTTGFLPLHSKMDWYVSIISENSRRRIADVTAVDT